VVISTFAASSLVTSSGTGREQREAGGAIQDGRRIEGNGTMWLDERSYEEDIYSKSTRPIHDTDWRPFMCCQWYVCCLIRPLGSNLSFQLITRGQVLAFFDIGSSIAKNTRHHHGILQANLVLLPPSNLCIRPCQHVTFLVSPSKPQSNAPTPTKSDRHLTQSL
jgi:hypothetical protein